MSFTLQMSGIFEAPQKGKKNKTKNDALSGNCVCISILYPNLIRLQPQSFCLWQMINCSELRVSLHLSVGISCWHAIRIPFRYLCSVGVFWWVVAPPPSSNALPLITQSISDSDIVSNRFTFLTFCGHGYTLDPIHSLSWLKIYFLKNVFLMIILNYPVMASGDMAGSIVWFHMLWRRSTRIKSALWLQPIVDYSRSRSFAVGCKGMRQRKRTTVFQQVQPTIQL